MQHTLAHSFTLLPHDRRDLCINLGTGPSHLEPKCSGLLLMECAQQIFITVLIWTVNKPKQVSIERQHGD